VSEKDKFALIGRKAVDSTHRFIATHEDGDIEVLATSLDALKMGEKIVRKHAREAFADDGSSTQGWSRKYEERFSSIFSGGDEGEKSKALDLDKVEPDFSYLGISSIVGTD